MLLCAGGADRRHVSAALSGMATPIYLLPRSVQIIDVRIPPATTRARRSLHGCRIPLGRTTGSDHTSSAPTQIQTV